MVELSWKVESIMQPCATPDYCSWPLWLCLKGPLFFISFRLRNSSAGETTLNWICLCIFYYFTPSAPPWHHTVPQTLRVMCMVTHLLSFAYTRGVCPPGREMSELDTASLNAKAAGTAHVCLWLPWNIIFFYMTINAVAWLVNSSELHRADTVYSGIWLAWKTTNWKKHSNLLAECSYWPLVHTVKYLKAGEWNTKYRE